MWLELRKHRWAYVSLLLGLAAFVILFLGAWPNRGPLRVVSIAMAAFYLMWGVSTHVKTQTLTKQVFYEYLGVASLAGIGLLAMTL